MKFLQTTIPVLFQLTRSLGYYPSLVVPIVKEMITKSQAPFGTIPAVDNSGTSRVGSLLESCGTKEVESLCFFPTLSIVRKRRKYKADAAKHPFKVCTKKNAGHPSLLPGVFTLFCHHGKCTCTILAYLLSIMNLL